MIASFALLLACALPQDAEPACTLEVRPLEAAIGEPVEWTLTVPHEYRDEVRLVDDDPIPDDTWVLVDGPRFSIERKGSREATTRVRWTVFSLDPGERALPEIVARFASGAEIRSTSLGPLTVRGELAPDEDAPRPLTAFHEIEERTGRGGPTALAILALLAGSVVFWLVLRRRRAQASTPVMTPLEQLDALGGRTADDPGVAREVVYELSSLLREAVDRRLEAPRPGLTDDEWLASVRANQGLERTTVERLEALLGSCEDVKYGNRVPTRFAVAEALEETRNVLTALDVEREEVPV